jgi:fermentation-respiration switch protein FrsA (DUF1100 family)
LVGRSLGGAVAIHTLRELEEINDSYFKGAIIENTFTSINDMADSVFSFFKWIPAIKKRMLRLKWESIDQVEHISTPLFFISGDKDTFVPTEQTHRLHNSATKTKYKEIWIVKGGEHNNTFAKAGIEYFERI